MACTSSPIGYRSTLSIPKLYSGSSAPNIAKGSADLYLGLWLVESVSDQEQYGSTQAHLEIALNPLGAILAQNSEPEDDRILGACLSGISTD